MAMTDEQIDLEYEHMLLDIKEKQEKDKVYVDDEYEQYDQESEDDDYTTDAPSPSEASNLPNEAETFNEDEWEEVDEIDDFYDEYD